MKQPFSYSGRVARDCAFQFMEECIGEPTIEKIREWNFNNFYDEKYRAIILNIAKEIYQEGLVGLK